MPSEKSLYRKMQIFLEYSAQNRTNNIVELIELIKKDEPINFIIGKYDPNIDDLVYEISERSIKKIFKLASLLNLVNDETRLTKDGLNAIGEDKFDKVLSKQIKKYFNKIGLDLNKLNEFIIDCLHKKEPIMPTAFDIWRFNCSDKIKFNLFNRLLTLLSQTEMAEVSQRKIYLKFY